MNPTVTLHPSGKRFQAADGESVLAAALRNGLNLPHSCRGGSCMSCQARILSGKIDYPRGTPAALSPADLSSSQALLCQAVATSDLEVEIAPLETPGNIRIRRLPCRVQTATRLCPDVMELGLKLPGFEPFEYLAGQYVDILLSGGERRSFSIANPPHTAGLLQIHVRRVAGGRFSDYVFEQMKPRALLRLEGPLGQFYLREDRQRPVLLMGGGTGYGPLKAILAHVFHLGWDRPVQLYWGVRDRVDLYDQQQLLDWSGTHPGFRFVPVLSEPGDDGAWEGRTGFVHQAVVADIPDLSGWDVYMAGPPPMIEAARALFPRHGLPAQQLFFDSFDYARPLVEPAG
ncbi:MAG: CDP-6-deoxy-delta-3,4-glucoseen reductase [Gammaproteobacteria bacterium]